MILFTTQLKCFFFFKFQKKTLQAWTVARLTWDVSNPPGDTPPVSAPWKKKTQASFHPPLPFCDFQGDFLFLGPSSSSHTQAELLRDPWRIQTQEENGNSWELIKSAGFVDNILENIL